MCVDDSERDRKDLQRILTNHAAFNLVGAFDNAQDCLEFITSNDVSLLFLDIVLPEESGLWLANEIRHLPIAIIFTTAYTEYALRAFEACALDYILKPIIPQDIDKILERLQLKIEKHTGLINSQQIEEVYNYYQTKNKSVERIFIATIGKTHIVELKDIMYITGVAGYTNIHLANGERIVSSKHLKVYTDVIGDHESFLRIHRSTLVNKQYIKTLLRTGKSQNHGIQMVNGDVLKISSLRKDDIFKQIIQ